MSLKSNRGFPLSRAVFATWHIFSYYSRVRDRLESRHSRTRIQRVIVTNIDDCVLILRCVCVSSTDEVNVGHASFTPTFRISNLRDRCTSRRLEIIPHDRPSLTYYSYSS